MPDSRPAMHQPVGDRVDIAHPRGEVAQGGDGIGIAVGLLLVLDPVIAVDHAQLQAARARIDGEDAHRSARGGSRVGSPSSGPPPLTDLGHVLEMLTNVRVVPPQLSGAVLVQLGGAGGSAP